MTLDKNYITYTYNISCQLDLAVDRLFQTKLGIYEPSEILYNYKIEATIPDIDVEKYFDELLGVKPYIRRCFTDSEIYSKNKLQTPINRKSHSEQLRSTNIDNKDRYEHENTLNVVYDLTEEKGVCVSVSMRPGWSASSIVIFYSEKDNNAYLYAKDIIERFHTDVIQKDIEKKHMYVVVMHQQEYTLVEMDVNNMSQYDIADLYNDDFINVDKKIIGFINDDRSGLVILHGVPGSGKTSYIRRLIYQCDDTRFVYIPHDMMSAFSTPQFASFIRNELRNCVLIIEDCESLLCERTKSLSSSGLTNIMNIADGLYGDTTKIKIICTFNADMSMIDIDKALMRKGRLVQSYKFNNLDTIKSNALYKKINGLADDADDVFDKPTSVADIFYYGDNNIVDDKQEKKKVNYI